MKEVLIIGANSYIGKSLFEFILNYNHQSRADVENIVAVTKEGSPSISDMLTKEGNSSISNLRTKEENSSNSSLRIKRVNEEPLHINMISASKGEWKSEDFSKYDTVLHLSGIVHKKEKKDMEELYNKVNHKLPVAIAKKAKENSVRQFIFVSTAAVYGEKAVCIKEDTEPNPTTYYGKSKLAAEQDIMKLQSKEFAVAIVRPPMVYGEGCNGNYPRLVKLARLMPIFPKLHNKRSMIHIDRLCEFLYEIAVQGKGGYYFPQDEEYVDTCELVVRLRAGMGKKTCLIRIFNPMIRVLMLFSSSLNKMFGDCYYEQ